MAATPCTVSSPTRLRLSVAVSENTYVASLTKVAVATALLADEMVKGMINEDDTAAIVRVQFDGEATDVSDTTKDALRSAVSDLDSVLPSGSQTSGSSVTPIIRCLRKRQKNGS